MTERLPLNKRDKELIKIWAGGTGITAEIAAAAKRHSPHGWRAETEAC
jgi:allophanate hydrolase subunit 1